MINKLFELNITQIAKGYFAILFLYLQIMAALYSTTLIGERYLLESKDVLMTLSVYYLLDLIDHLKSNENEQE